MASSYFDARRSVLLIDRRRMRNLVSIVAALGLVFAAPVLGDAPSPEVFVKARLVALARQPGCGVVLFGSTATYEVIDGPSAYVGKRVHVIVDCVEMPRSGMSTDSGDLEAFEVGATHFLALTKDNIRQIEVPSSLPSRQSWFYLRAASLHELPPNSSLERMRENRVPSPTVGARGAQFNR